MDVSKLRWKVAQWFERMWWKKYLVKKNVAEYLSWKKQYWKQFYDTCKDIVPLHPTFTILDAGCGPAGIFMIFEHNEVHAIDPLLDSYETDLPHFKKNNYSFVTFANTTLEDYNSTKKFDIIFCINAINHVKSMNQALDNLIHHAAPKANIIISIDAHNFNALKKIFKLLPGDILHPHQYNLQEYQQMMEQKGIRILRTLCMKKEFIFNYYVIIGELV